MSGDEQLLEFGSAAWLARLAQAFQHAAAARPDHAFPVACEIYRDVPPHLLPVGAEMIAWTRRARDGRASLSLDECGDAEADVKFSGTYAAFHRLARFLVTEDNVAEYRRLIDEALARGALTIVCDRRDPAIPPDYTVHNIMARVTR